MVFQNYALYPHMTVYRNMAFALRARRLPGPEIDRRVREAAGILELEGLLTRRPSELSGGQRQRVAIGRAMVRHPQVFLFDEPLSNLDAQLRHQMRAEIKKLHQKVRTTIVYVTHDQVEAMTLADRIVILRAGRVEQIGTPVEVYRRPANLFVAGFIGTPGMNFLPAWIEADGDVAAAVLADGTRWTLRGPIPGSLASGGPVTVGIRPDDLRLVGDGAGEVEGEVTGPVSVVEPLGNETLLSVMVAGQEVTARADGLVAAPPGDRVRLAPRLANLHLFDPATGVVLR
jgi:multiple sugar transport system ATP-binding protein